MNRAEIGGAGEEPQLEEKFDWSVLLAYVRDRRVVPVLGRELLVDAAAPGTLLQHKMARKLAETLGVSLDGLRAPIELHDVIFRYSQKNRSLQKPYVQIREMLDAEKPPSPLVQLASITDFDLFVCTTFDSLMTRALDDVRFGGNPGKTKTLSFSPSARLDDLDAAHGPRNGPVVYNIFGQATLAGDYALTEEETLEYVRALQSDKRPKNLFDALQSRNLLFIGCGFPDWLARFFIRTMNNERFLDRNRNRREVFADSRAHSDANLVVFLRQYDAQVFRGGDAASFVDELWTQWSKAARPSTPSSAPSSVSARVVRDVPRDVVFLSFASEDRERARDIKTELEAAGLKVWFDESDIPAGVDWEVVIEDGIRHCSLFLPIITHNTESVLESHFRTEWRLALTRAKRIAEEIPFIVPIALDFAPEAARHVPPGFKPVQWIRPEQRGSLVDLIKVAFRKWKAPEFSSPTFP